MTDEQSQLKAMIGMQMRIEIQDGRVLEGEFHCIDSECNIILSEAYQMKKTTGKEESLFLSGYLPRVCSCLCLFIMCLFVCLFVCLFICLFVCLYMLTLFVCLFYNKPTQVGTRVEGSKRWWKACMAPEMALRAYLYSLMPLVWYWSFLSINLSLAQGPATSLLLKNLN